MGKQEKGLKYYCRTREVSKQKLEKLNKNINIQCQDCMHDCKNEINEQERCKNRQSREDINEISNMLKEENVNLYKLCTNYNLKLYILMDALRGNRLLPYKYYICLMDRLHLVKNSDEINNEYQQLKKDGVDI